MPHDGRIMHGGRITHGGSITHQLQMVELLIADNAPDALRITFDA